MSREANLPKIGREKPTTAAEAVKMQRRSGAALSQRRREAICTRHANPSEGRGAIVQDLLETFLTWLTDTSCTDLADELGIKEGGE